MDAVSHLVETNHDAILAIATALLALVTAGLAWVAWVQLRTTRRQLRAYVMIADVSMKNFDIGETPRVRVVIKNFGQTPAHRIRVQGQVGFQPLPFKDVDWPRFDFIDSKTARPLAPSDELITILPFRTPLAAVQVQATRSGEAAFYATGKVIYEDAFGRPRYTNFCLFTSKESGVGNFAAVEDRNSCS